MDDAPSPAQVGATMCSGVEEFTLHSALASALRPLVHPPSSVTINRDLASKVYWDSAIAWLGIQTPTFRRYSSQARTLRDGKGTIAFHRGVFLSLDTIVGTPLLSDEVDDRTGQPGTMIEYLFSRAKAFSDVVKREYQSDSHQERC
jgi:hypothetical protein